MTEILNEYESKGLLYSQIHPILPLKIYNYTDKVQWEGLWDNVTRMCRGLVVDNLGNIVARPFKKFFNLTENRTNTSDEFEIYEKLDGSLGILFFYAENWIFASRGSFTSDQAIKGKELLDSICNYKFLNKSSTYCFEIIYKENKIVVGYDYEAVILTGVFDTKSGREYSLDEQFLPTVKRFKNIHLPKEKLHENIKNNEEGYVLRFSNGERCKIKGAEYLRLHKMMSEMSTIAVWECLRNGDDISDKLLDFPDEFYSLVKEYEEKLLSLFEYWHHFFKLEYLKYRDIKDDKLFALSVKNNEYKSFMFSIKNDKNLEQQIWRFIKPKYEKL